MNTTRRPSLSSILLLAFGLGAVAPGRCEAQEPNVDPDREAMIRRVEAIAAEGHLPASAPFDSTRVDLVDPARRFLDSAADSARLSSVSVTGPAPLRRAPALADSSAPLARYGDELFAEAASSFTPPTFGPIDPGYRLGPGDEIVIDVWGDIVFRHDKTLDRGGNVLLPDAGQVNLQGLTLAKARDRLRDRFSTSLSGLSRDPATTFLDVSLARLRPLKVFVVGEARRPGAYDLSAASTVLHALYAAGGPSEHGSLRDVRVLRGDRVVASLDVAEYLARGTRTGDVRLENDDTIFIPSNGPMVTAEGEIGRRAVYEMKEGETLGDLIAMAGGLTARTYVERAQVARVLSPEERRTRLDDEIVIDVDLGAVLDGSQPFPLRDRDNVHFFSIVGERRNYVSLAGSVWRPGTYELRPGMRVTDLLAAADGPKPEAFVERSLLVRTRDDRTRETMTFDLGRALAGDASHDLELARWDEVTVLSVWDLRDPESVTIQGAIRKPARYELTEGMTLGDLLLKAGGFHEYAFPLEVEISRVDPLHPDSSRSAESFKVAVAPEFPRGDAVPSFALRDHDQVFVRRRPFWELQRNVTVEGEVLYPGGYTLLRSNETLAEVIDRAGGLLPSAHAAGFRLTRAEDGVGPISVDLERALEKPNSADNLALSEGDVLQIPKRLMTVRVSGAVGLPTSLVYKKGAGIGHYIDDAGGVLDSAKEGETTVVYSTGRAAKVKRFWFDPKPEPGSVIVVPAKSPDAGIDWGGTIKDVAAILASLATTVLVVDRLAD